MTERGCEDHQSGSSSGRVGLDVTIGSVQLCALSS